MSLANPSPDVVYVEAECVAETPLAIRIRLCGGTRARYVWLPHSGVHEDSDVYALGHRGRLALYRWCARDKEIG